MPSRGAYKWRSRWSRSCKAPAAGEATVEASPRIPPPDSDNETLGQLISDAGGTPVLAVPAGGAGYRLQSLDSIHMKNQTKKRLCTPLHKERPFRTPGFRVYDLYESF